MDLVKIGSYIAEKRKKLGMTQKQLAEKLGKSDKSVSKWERGICLPDVSVYLELCEILGISLNEFLAGEDIEVTNVEKKSEDTLIQITKDSSYKQRYLKKIIAVLLIAVGVCVIVFGIMVCNKLRQPQNYIEAVAPDSVEMKTAELLSGIDGTMMFRYNSKDTFQALYVYLSEYHSGKRVSHKRVLELSYEDVKSAKNGLIVITPDFDNFTAKLIAADEYSKYMTETGFRIGELLGVRYAEDIDYEKHIIYVNFRDDNENGARAKNAELRRAKISDATFDILMFYIEDYKELIIGQEYLFINVSGDYVGKPFKGSGVYAMLRRLERKTGIKASPHMLRHYFANARRKDGWKLEMISQALGHRNIETTMKYLNITEDELIEVSDAFYNRHQAMYGVQNLL